MAQTEHLPIYQAAYDLCLHLEQAVGRFGRAHRYGLGAELREGARRVLRLVVRANARRAKAPVLLELREAVEDLKVLCRLGHDVKAFSSFDAFEHASTQVVAIAKQNEGWLRSQGHAGPGQSRRDTRVWPGQRDALAHRVVDERDDDRARRARRSPAVHVSPAVP